MKNTHLGFFLLAAFVLMSSQARAVTYGDSFDGWSVSGLQGENGWINGYRNVTTDGGAPYDGSQFLSFNNLFGPGGGPTGPGPADNHWTGSFWDMVPGGPPWLELTQEYSHPSHNNAVAGQEDHWSVRRWVAGDVLLAPTDVTLKWSIRKDNISCGDGVIGRLFVNGVEVDSAPIAFNDNVGVTRYYETTLTPADLVDLALDPGPVLGGNDFCDGSRFRLTINDEAPPMPPPPPIADSHDDWSFSGSQGENNWFNGYRNRSADGGGPYQTSQFIAFTNNPGGPDNHWDGTNWALGPGDPPWTLLGRLDTHPNSVPNGAEHWTMRRWVADVASPTPATLQWQMKKGNLGCGDGVTGVLFVNGQQVDAASIAFNDGIGVNRQYYANLYPGDLVDLALTPTDPNNDGCDGSQFRLTVHPGAPAGIYNRGEKLADTRADWSTAGNQGENNWLYGWYDRTADPDTTYSIDDTQIFDQGSHWTGSEWHVDPNNKPPWTILGSGDTTHPNGDNNVNVHYTVRRWLSEVTEPTEVEVMWSIRKQNTGGGNGVTGLVYVDGVLLDSATIGGTDGVGVTRSFVVTIGPDTIIDFAHSPLGLDGFFGDGADGTFFGGMVTRVLPFTPIPEPSTYVLTLIGIALLAVARRRK